MITSLSLRDAPTCVTDLAVVSPPMRVSDGEGHVSPTWHPCDPKGSG